MKILKIHILFLSIIGFTLNSYTQEAKKVKEILQKAQETSDNQPTVSSRLTYNLYPTYSHKKPSESYIGKSIKNGDYYYTKIHETIFLTNIKTNKSLKLNKEEKIIQVGENNIANAQVTLDLMQTFIKLFKFQTVTDNGSQWICTLTTDAITQLPYGKIELFIDKKDYKITKQVLYFLGQFPYKNKEGKTVNGNPKLEIVISDYKTTITKQEKLNAKLSTYILYNKTSILPSAEYKDFKIVQN